MLDAVGYNIEGQFQQGTSSIYLTLIERDGKFQVIGLHINAIS